MDHTNWAETQLLTSFSPLREILIFTACERAFPLDHSPCPATTLPYFECFSLPFGAWHHMFVVLDPAVTKEICTDHKTGGSSHWPQMHMLWLWVWQCLRHDMCTLPSSWHAFSHTCSIAEEKVAYLCCSYHTFATFYLWGPQCCYVWFMWTGIPCHGSGSVSLPGLGLHAEPVWHFVAARPSFWAVCCLMSAADGTAGMIGTGHVFWSSCFIEDLLGVFNPNLWCCSKVVFFVYCGNGSCVSFVMEWVFLLLNHSIAYSM